MRSFGLERLYGVAANRPAITTFSPAVNHGMSSGLLEDDTGVRAG